jgi:hypothetical protein
MCVKYVYDHHNDFWENLFFGSPENLLKWSSYNIRIRERILLTAFQISTMETFCILRIVSLEAKRFFIVIKISKNIIKFKSFVYWFVILNNKFISFIINIMNKNIKFK